MPLVTRRGTVYEATARARHRAAANTGLAYAAALACYRRVGGEVPLDDLTAEALEALTRAAAAFDPARGWKFSTLAVLSMNRQLSQYVKQVRQRRRRLPGFSLDRVLASGGVADGGEARHPYVPEWLCGRPPRFDAEQRAHDRHRLERLLRCLPPRDRAALRCHYLDEMTLEQTGEALGFSKERARQLVTRAVLKVRRAVARGQGERIQCRSDTTPD